MSESQKRGITSRERRQQVLERARRIEGIRHPGYDVETRLGARRHRDCHHGMRANAAFWSIGSQIRENTQASNQDYRCHPSSPHRPGKPRAYPRST